MPSIAASLKSRLEEHGEVVVLANVSSGWFAVNPKTWASRTEQARRGGRKGSNLVVYRTRSEEPRDHYVIPFSIVRELLTSDTVRQQQNGALRWNLALRDGQLRVTHRPGTVDVREYYGVQLLIESGIDEIPKVSELKTDEAIAEAILEGVLRETTVITRSRSRKLRAAALRRSKGICEVCGVNFSLLLHGKGLRALQVHHKQQLALQDKPTVTNLDELAVVCANCHCMLHSDPRNTMDVEILRGLLAAKELHAALRQTDG